MTILLKVFIIILTIWWHCIDAIQAVYGRSDIPEPKFTFNPRLTLLLPENITEFLADANSEDELEYVWQRLVREYANTVDCHSRRPDKCPEYQDLVRYLANKTDLLSMPDAKTIINVGISLELYKITSLDLDKGLMRTAGRWLFYWKDPRLAYRGDSWFPNWNSAYDYVVLPSGARGNQLIWYPQVVPGRSVEENWQEHGSEYMRPRIYDERFMRAKGYNVVWMRILSTPTDCSVWLEAFPFDSQVCSLTFEEATEPFVHLQSTIAGYPTPIMDQFAKIQEFYDVSNVGVQISYNSTDQNAMFQYVDSVRNRVRSSHSVKGISRAYARYFLVIERKAHYFVLNFVWPLLLALTFSYLYFWLPFDWFDRVTLTVTICTAMFDVFWLIMDLRPRSRQESWLDTFQAKCVLLTAIPAVQTILLSHIVNLFARWQQNRTIEEDKLKKLINRVQQIEINRVQELLSKKEQELLFRPNDQSNRNKSTKMSSLHRLYNSMRSLKSPQASIMPFRTSRHSNQNTDRRRTDNEVQKIAPGALIFADGEHRQEMPEQLGSPSSSVCLPASHGTSLIKTAEGSTYDVTVTLPEYVDRLCQIAYPSMLIAVGAAQSGTVLTRYEELASSLIAPMSAASLTLTVFWVTCLGFLWIASMILYANKYCARISLE